MVMGGKTQSCGSGCVWRRGVLGGEIVVDPALATVKLSRAWAPTGGGMIRMTGRS